MSITVGSEFERLARAFFAAHPGITHEWRRVASRTWGDRLDLVCGVGTSAEVSASIRPGTIAIGSPHKDEDVGGLGERLSEVELAMLAWDQFTARLRAAGLVDPPV